MEKKDEDVGMVKMDRMAILQEARVFNTSPVQPRKCRILLTKLALLLFSGESYNANESTSLFCEY
jgi:coatomer subunit gamma